MIRSIGNVREGDIKEMKDKSDRRWGNARRRLLITCVHMYYRPIPVSRTTLCGKIIHNRYNEV